jgi:para-nitrobenzyl esterase
LPAAPLEAAARRELAPVPLIVGSARDETRIHDLVDPSLAELPRADVAARLEALGIAPAAAQDGLALARALEPGASPSALFHRAATELRYAEPARRLAAAHAARGAPTFLYRFDLAGSSAQGDTGAFHGLELPLIFGTRRIAPLGRFFDDVADAKPVGRRMRDAWTAFARSGDPRAPLTEPWPAYTTADRATLVFDASPHVERSG